MGVRRRVAALLALALLFSGCWDRQELEDQAYIIFLGVDRTEDAQLLVSARVAQVQPLSSGVLGGTVEIQQVYPAAQYVSARAGTIVQAIHIMNGGMARRLDLRHLRTVFIGEAAGQAGIEPVVLELMRDPVARGTIALVQVRGRAADLLYPDAADGDVNPARKAEGYLLQGKSLHLAPPVRLQQFAMHMAAPGGDPFLPGVDLNPAANDPTPPLPDGGQASALPGELPRTGGDILDAAGTAIYRHDRLAGFLNVDETQMLLALRGEMGKAYVTMPDPEQPDAMITLRLHQENVPHLQATLTTSGRPRVTVRILFEAEVLAAPGGTDYTRPDARQRLEQATGRFTEANMRRVLDRLRAWGADPVGFGHLFRGHFARWEEWEAFDWAKRVPDLQVEVAVDVRVRRYALTLGSDRLPSQR